MRSLCGRFLVRPPTGTDDDDAARVIMMTVAWERRIFHYADVPCFQTEVSRVTG